jgi:hypothetical protein
MSIYSLHILFVKHIISIKGNGWCFHRLLPGIFIYPVSLFIYYTVFYDTNIQPKNLDYCNVL